MAKVTVLMPTFNVSQYVKDAVESVLGQTYSDFELLVIDDCSSDNTIDIVRGIKDPRIRIERNERNLGLADNLNRGLSLIKTEYVARMDGDDIALPHWLEKEMFFLEAHPEVGVCGGGGERFGTMSSVISFPEEHEDICVNMLFNCSIVVPTFRMSLYNEYGLRYRSESFPAEDYRFWSEAILVTRLHNIKEPLFRYRMHQFQICSSLQLEQRSKMVDVRKKMVAHIEGLTIQEIDFFIGQFHKSIMSSADWRQRNIFVNRLLHLNRANCFYHNKALKQGLLFHLRQVLFYTIVNRFFKSGYTLPAYVGYLKSGLALRSGWHYESRFFLKSVLHRTK